ncbi:MAG: dihydrofolate reductase, partial [Prevotella sp.]|nr:dihydrofolate reductase [Prevotella sp.]
CLGHGSGQLLPGVSVDALKAYGDIIEEARADLFGLYYIADEKLIELGLLPDEIAYKSQYYTYFMNGLMTQLTRIELGNQIEEAHMRNRALITRWCYEKGRGENLIELIVKEGKTFVRINDYSKLRTLIGDLLAEIQRIKSEGDYEAARNMVENYGVKVDRKLHEEVKERFDQLHIAPYKGFLNPVMKPIVDENGEITDVEIDYSEGYSEQMMRYSRDYSCLI